MFSVLIARVEIKSLIFPRLLAALLTVLGHVGPLSSGGQKDNSETHIEIKVVTGYVQVFQRQRKSKGERQRGVSFVKSLLYICPIGCFF